MGIMVRMRETIDSFDVVGLPLRTSNREAARTIPPHWRAAADAGILESGEQGAGSGIYAVYTDYETPGDDVNGVYTLVIGRRTEVGGPVLARDYRADYEYYGPDGSTRLSIGVLSDV